MEQLFQKEVPLVVKLNDREQKHQRIGVSVHLNSSISSLHSKELSVRLTDENDPYFLYSLTVNEDDFIGLKSQQGLLVDFHAFPQKFIDLLNLCLSESHNDCPKFHLQFAVQGGDRGLLDIIEANPFKHLTHLSLKMVHANDTALKKYLTECIVTLKEERNSLSHTLSNVKMELMSKLSHTEESLSQRTRELEQLKSEWSDQNSSLVTRHSREVEMERERSLHAQNSITKKYEEEKKSLTEGFEERIKQLDAKIQYLEMQNKELNETRYRLEASLSETKSKNNLLDEELLQLRAEVQQRRKENGNYDTTLHQLERSVNQLTTRSAVQEQEIKDKDAVISRSNELLDVANEHKFKLESAVEQKQKQIAKLETAFKTASQEVLKGNEIIQKLQNDIKRHQEKVKLKNVAVTQQEKLLGEKESSLDHQRKENETLKRAILQKDEEIGKCKESVEDLKQELEKAREMLKTNENVINWLNKQANERIMSHGSHVTSSSTVRHSAGPLTTTGAAITFQRPQFTSTPANTGTRQAFGSLGNQQNIQQVVYRGGSGIKVTPPSTTGAAPNPGFQGKGDEENKGFVAPKYLPPGPSPLTHSSPMSLSSVRPVGLPSRATHQYAATPPGPTSAAKTS